LRKHFAKEGFDTILEHKKREVPPAIKTGREVEAKIIALAYSQPPEGRVRWTLRLLAGKAMELGIRTASRARASGTCLKKRR